MSKFKPRKERKLRNWIGLCCLICILLSACIDPIDFESNLNNSFVSINGYISNKPETYSVSVRRSGTAQQKEENISNAEVRIISDDGNVVSLTETHEGIYESDTDDIVGEVGKSYHISVLLPSGDIYESIPEKMLAPAPIGELSFDFVREEVLNELSNIVLEKRVKVYVSNDIPIAPQNLFYKWEVVGEYEFRETEALSDIYATTGAGPTLLTCYLDDPSPLRNISILNASRSQIGQSFRQEISVIPVNYKFSFNYCIHVNQLSITAEAFQFWEQIQQTASRNGLFLEAAPGSITGNIFNPNDPSEKVMGYFYTAAIDSKRIFVPAEAVDNPLSPCFNIDPDFQNACDNCLSLKESRQGAPDYWPQ